jgi:hypothetical protein
MACLRHEQKREASSGRMSLDYCLIVLKAGFAIMYTPYASGAPRVASRGFGINFAEGTVHPKEMESHNA